MWCYTWEYVAEPHWLHFVSSFLSSQAYSLPFHTLQFMELPTLFFGLKVPSHFGGYYSIPLPPNNWQASQKTENETGMGKGTMLGESPLSVVEIPGWPAFSTWGDQAKFGMLQTGTWVWGHPENTKRVAGHSNRNNREKETKEGNKYAMASALGPETDTEYELQLR